MNGYSSVAPIENDVVNQFQQFQRYAKLYKFARLLSSLDYGEINDKPTWLDELRGKLIRVSDELRKSFQKSIN